MASDGLSELVHCDRSHCFAFFWFQSDFLLKSEFDFISILVSLKYRGNEMNVRRRKNRKRIVKVSKLGTDLTKYLKSDPNRKGNRDVTFFFGLKIGHVFNTCYHFYVLFEIFV